MVTEKENSAGRISQYGFIFQRYVFIKLALDYAGNGRFLVYEGVDDIDVQDTDRIDSVHVSNDLYYQVKSGNISRDCWAKVLGNWLLINNNSTRFVAIFENEPLFNIKDDDVINSVCDYFFYGKDKKSSSIANKVYRAFVDNENEQEAKSILKERVNDILKKVNYEVLPADKLLNDITTSFLSVYCQDIRLYNVAKSCRCERFIYYLQSSIDEALMKKESFTLRYNDLISIVSKVTSEISDHKYLIDISEMKKRKRAEAQKMMNNDISEVHQLRQVNSNPGFVLKELINELLYKDFREVYSDFEKVLISNIEESAYSNYEDTLYSLPKNPTAKQLFDETVDKEIPMSIVENSPIYRHGCYVFLTSEEADEENRISWELLDE